MKQAYLKGYYGYKNFWDELLFFGVVNRIFSHYPEINQLVVEVWNKSWMEYRVKKNYQEYFNKEQFQKLCFVEIKQHRRKRITHLLSLIGFWKYKKHFKFFGGWEVLSDERNFPHDWRNIPLLFWSTIRKGNFMLIWGIWKPQKNISKFLYNILLPRAKWIILREETSYKTVIKRNKFSSIHQDFSQDIIKNQKCHNQKPEEYVLINANTKSWNPKTKKDIIDFCKNHANNPKIYFPCDMNDDINCFYELQKDIPDLEIYDRTKNSLWDSLCLFKNSTAAIGARLHFLLPLKIYNKKFIAIKYAEKIYKMID